MAAPGAGGWAQGWGQGASKLRKWGRHPHPLILHFLFWQQGGGSGGAKTHFFMILLCFPNDSAAKRRSGNKVRVVQISTFFLAGKGVWDEDKVDGEKPLQMPNAL